jgi:hypothetical protein
MTGRAKELYEAGRYEELCTHASNLEWALVTADQFLRGELIEQLLRGRSSKPWRLLQEARQRLTGSHLPWSGSGGNQRNRPPTASARSPEDLIAEALRDDGETARTSVGGGCMVRPGETPRKGKRCRDCHWFDDGCHVPMPKWVTNDDEFLYMSQPDSDSSLAVTCPVFRGKERD